MHDVFFFTDLHGQIRLFNHMRDWCYRQDPECTIVYGGDAADRGEYGYAIIKALLNDPRIIYLRGNHEQLFINAAYDILGNYAASDEKYDEIHHVTDPGIAETIILNCKGEALQLHLYNGGLPTLREWLLDGANEDIIASLEELPYTFSYENIDFCHAGSTYSNFKTIADNEYNHKHRDCWAAHDLIWDRNSLPLGWETGRVCVFGHTPVVLLAAGLYGSRDKSERHAHPAAWLDHMGAKPKRGGWKIDMDTAATWSGRAYVLNASTMTVYGFYDPQVTHIAGAICEAFDNYKII